MPGSNDRPQRSVRGNRGGKHHGKASRVSGPQRIDRVLTGLLARRGYAQQQWAVEVGSAWRDAAGAELAAMTRPGRLRGGVLEIIVQNSSVLQELMFEKASLLEKLVRNFPDQPIRDVRFRIGVVDDPDDTAS